MKHASGGREGNEYNLPVISCEVRSFIPLIIRAHWDPAVRVPFIAVRPEYFLGSVHACWAYAADYGPGDPVWSDVHSALRGHAVELILDKTVDPCALLDHHGEVGELCQVGVRNILGLSDAISLMGVVELSMERVVQSLASAKGRLASQRMPIVAFAPGPRMLTP